MVGRRSWGGRRFRTLAPLLGLGVLLVTWDRLADARGAESAPERTAVRVVNAVATVVGGGYRGVADTVRGVVKAREIVAENQRLRDENAELEARITQLFSISLENKRLTELLKMQEPLRGRGIPARVIAVEAGPQAKRVTVNKGRRHGVGERFIALAPGGLVGRVLRDQVTATTAKVALIIDPRSAVAASVAASGDRGIVVGAPCGPGLGGQMLTMDLAGDAVVREGDVIVSSGHGGVYPRGHRIGRVVSVARNLADASQIAQVEPFVDFAHLDMLMLVPVD
jgi:rod shape-determining protein MreC